MLVREQWSHSMLFPNVSGPRWPTNKTWQVPFQPWGHRNFWRIHGPDPLGTERGIIVSQGKKLLCTWRILDFKHKRNYFPYNHEQNPKTTCFISSQIPTVQSWNMGPPVEPRNICDGLAGAAGKWRRRWISCISRAGAPGRWYEMYEQLVDSQPWQTGGKAQRG